MKNLLPIMPLILGLYFIWNGFNKVKELVIPKYDYLFGAKTSIFNDTYLYFNYGYYLIAAIAILTVLALIIIVAVLIKKPLPVLPTLLVTSLISIYVSQAISAMSAYQIPMVLYAESTQYSMKFAQKFRDAGCVPIKNPSTTKN